MRVLMLSASPGNGHNSTALKIKNKILSAHPDAEIKIVDMYKQFGSKFKAWTMEQGYTLACNHIVGVYNYFFKKSEKSNYYTRDKSKANMETFPMLYGLLKEIYDYKPDLIVCTYIFTAVAVTNLKRCYDIPAKVVCMTLDYGISPYWECATAMDEMFITDKYMIKPFLERGFKRRQLVVSGIPVGDEFSVQTDKKEARKKCGLDTDMFTLMVTRSSFFAIKNKQLIKEFSKIEKPVQIVICNGGDKKGKEQLDRLISKAKLPHKIFNKGYIPTDEFGLLFSSADMMLAKGGGLTLTEAMTKEIPVIIINKLPQQEIYNRNYLVEKGCALGVDAKNTVSQQINKVIENPKIYQNLIKNIKKIRKLNVLNTFLTHFEKYPKADYSKIVFKDTPKQLVHKINSARKEAVRGEKRAVSTKKMTLKI